MGGRSLRLFAEELLLARAALDEVGLLLGGSFTLLVELAADHVFAAGLTLAGRSRAS